jgi:hypothetical protein
MTRPEMLVSTRHSRHTSSWLPKARKAKDCHLDPIGEAHRVTPCKRTLPALDWT